MIFDTELAGAPGQCAARTGRTTTQVGAEEGRDFAARRPRTSPRRWRATSARSCEGTLDIARGIEIGHIFKLGPSTRSSLKVDFTDKDGSCGRSIMGTYGIGTSRIPARRSVEQHHDDGGIRWPRALAPLPVQMIVIAPERSEQAGAAGRLERELAALGHRDAR